MKKFVKVFCLTFSILALILTLGCTQNTSNKKTTKIEEGKPQPTTKSNETKFKVTSSAFENGSDIPIKYATIDVNGGQNLSIPLEWKNIPKGTKSIAITMVDTHKIADNFLHWLAINIDPKTISLEEGASGKKMPSFTTEFKNDYDKEGYGGPAPPAGSGDHEYVITVYALDIASMGMTENAGLKEFESFTKGKVLGTATLTGKFSQ